MKKGLFFVVGGIVLLVAIFLLSYYSFLYFNNRKPIVSVNTLEIELNDSGKVNLEEQQPLSDDQLDTVKPYKFKIKNRGKSISQYQLLIEDFVTDKSTKLLSRKYLNYQLSSNETVIKTGNLAEIKNNILDKNILKAHQEKSYELKIWVTGDIESTEWMGKTYNYTISVNPITD